uniref:Kynurenine--oxoglutarate transaminase 3-like n=2 Tax=Hirondellea gigas TaxID=1518452 RepID=A0A6A7FVK6_9CRUS
MTSPVKLIRADRASAKQGAMWDTLGQLALEVQPIDLGIGCPDFAASEALRQDFRDVVEDQDFTLHQYTKGFGHPRLCQALSALYSGLLGRARVDPETQIVITNGASEGLFVSLMGLVNPGDEVIIIEPFFDCYLPQIELAGGTAVCVPLRPGKSEHSSDWRLDEAELRAAFTCNTKVMIVNTPHNPTGKVFSRCELEMISSLCRQHNVIAISDEVYEWLTYDGVEHVRMASLPGMWERCITIGSAGKIFSVTGWKLGWMIAPAHLLNGPKLVHQNSGYICCTPTQEALARAFERETALLSKNSPNCYFLSLAREAEAKRDILVFLLREAGLKPIVPQGGYFVMADVRDIMNKIDVGGDPSEPKDFRFVKWLTKNRKLQAIPPSGFYSPKHQFIGENYIRLCFLKEDSTLSKAGEILRALGEELRDTVAS